MYQTVYILSTISMASANTFQQALLPQPLGPTNITPWDSL